VKWTLQQYDRGANVDCIHLAPYRALWPVLGNMVMGLGAGKLST
jgi:hypothetical protein